MNRMIWAVWLFSVTTCTGGQLLHDHGPILGKFVENLETKETIIKEIASWEGSPEVDRLMSVRHTVEENADIYKVGYKTKTGDVCEGELKKEGNATKSHKFECHKENIAGRSIHAILEDDEPLFGPNEHAEDNILKLEKFQRLHLNKKTKKKKKRKKLRLKEK
uniref:Uncharacterized protein n=2 Tax=Lygus hesperus TaxID=30085 RepID=A0A0K8SFS8_LYGHE